jgi:predicted DNA-binding transcriptional regulator AlpA
MELWTVEETAAFLKVTPRAVYEMSRRRSQVRQAQPLPAIRLHKKCLRFDKQAIEQWVTQCAQQGRTN